jgi:hypothetical protein
VRGAILTVQELREVVDSSISFVDVVKSRNLNEPANIVRVQLVLYNPFSELVPLSWRATIDANAPFTVLLS